MAKKTGCSLKSVVQIKNDVISRTVMDEEVLLSLESGLYFGLNPTATLVWEQLKSGQKLTEIAQNLSKEYELPKTDAEGDLLELIDNLHDQKLIEIK